MSDPVITLQRLPMGNAIISISLGSIDASDPAHQFARTLQGLANNNQRMVLPQTGDVIRPQIRDGNLIIRLPEMTTNDVVQGNSVNFVRLNNIVSANNAPAQPGVMGGIEQVPGTTPTNQPVVQNPPANQPPQNPPVNAPANPPVANNPGNRLVNQGITGGQNLGLGGGDRPQQPQGQPQTQPGGNQQMNVMQYMNRHREIGDRCNAYMTQCMENMRNAQRYMQASAQSWSQQGYMMGERAYMHAAMTMRQVYNGSLAQAQQLAQQAGPAVVQQARDMQQAMQGVNVGAGGQNMNSNGPMMAQVGPGMQGPPGGRFPGGRF